MPDLLRPVPDVSGRIWSIQYVRALAAIAVVVWHTGWSRTVLGQAGVDLFFVVSGFVMMLVSGNDASPVRFGLARVARIVPLYWMVTLLVAALDRSTEGELVSSLLFWPSGPFPVVLQGWSLNLEMAYYLLFALALFAPPRWRLLALTAMIGLGTTLLHVWANASPPAWLRDPLTAWDDPMAFEFVAGAGLHVLWRSGRLPQGAAAWALGAAGLVALLATHLFGAGLTGWTRLMLWGTPAIALVAAGLGIERAGQLPRLPVLGELGEASYSIYLTHLLVLRMLSGLLVSFWAPVATVLAVAASCLVGWAVHRLLERPAHLWTNGWLRRVWPKRQLRPA